MNVARMARSASRMNTERKLSTGPPMDPENRTNPIGWANVPVVTPDSRTSLGNDLRRTLDAGSPVRVEGHPGRRLTQDVDVGREAINHVTDDPEL